MHVEAEAGDRLNRDPAFYYIGCCFRKVMSDKTKELLEGLGNILRKPSAFEHDKMTTYTNMFYTSIPEDIHKLPKRYDKAKRHKDVDGDEYIWIDRVYGGLYGGTLREANGYTYKGKLSKKRRLIERKDMFGETQRFYSRCTVTADGRWFDNCGLPIEKPSMLEPEKVKTKEEIEEEKQEKAEIAKRKEAEILSKLK